MSIALLVSHSRRKRLRGCFGRGVVKCDTPQALRSSLSLCLVLVGTAFVLCSWRLQRTFGDTFQKEIRFGRTGSCFCLSPQGQVSSDSAITSTCLLLLHGVAHLGFVSAGAQGSAESSSLPRRASTQEPVLPGRVAAGLQTLP